MEACLAVQREQEKVVKKLRTVSGTATEKLQHVLDQIQALKGQLMAAGVCSLPHSCLCVVRNSFTALSVVSPCAAPGSAEVTQEQREAAQQCMRGVKEAAQAASNEHKDMHATISKLGKAIDKVCTTCIWSGLRERVNVVCRISVLISLP